MDVELNATYITLNGFIELHKYRYLYFVIMFTIYILILCCNSTVIFLIVSQRSLHEPMHIFIAGLLLNSILFSTAVFPKLLMDLLSERQIISIPACVFQHFMFYTLVASEFLLLTVMAFDRYVSICIPLQYPVIMSKRTVSILLALPWTISAFHASAFKLVILNYNPQLCSSTLKGIYCNSRLYDPVCSSSTASVIVTIIILINVAVFPVILICFSYTSILIISCRSCVEVRTKAAQTCFCHSLHL